MSTGLHKKAGICRNVCADLFSGIRNKDIFKKSEHLFFHIQGKFPAIKRKRRQFLKTGRRNSLLGADHTEKLLDVFAVVINFLSDLFNFI